MIKTFFKGLVFTFAILITLVLFDRFTPYSILGDRLDIFDSLIEDIDAGKSVAPRHFYQLSLDEKIKRSSIVLRTEYVDGTETLVELLKRDEDTEFFYEIGDEFDPFEGYRDTTVDYGEGNIVFLAGSPADLKMSMSYSENRIPEQDGTTLDVLRAKCGAPTVAASTDMAEPTTSTEQAEVLSVSDSTR